MKLQDIFVSEVTKALLNANGMSDAKCGIEQRAGWSEVCVQAGYTDNEYTPAKLAYDEGYASVPLVDPGELGVTNDKYK